MIKIVSADPIAQSLLTWVTAVKRGLPPQDVAKSRLNQLRLEDFVLRVLDLDVSEAARIDALANSDSSFERGPERFYDMLQKTIW